MIAPGPSPEGFIRLRGVRQNNLKSIDCDLPLGRLIAVTGVSGSGKSSLAFDTLYAEGQRRYIETFSSYTRQFLDRRPRPDADALENLPPAVAIDQAGAIKTSRSTVGTLTGINDYLKLLFARTATPFCPSCGRKIEPEGVSSALEHMARVGDSEYPLLITTTVPLGGFDSLPTVIRAFQAQGHVRYLRGTEVRRIEELEDLDLESPALELVVDRISGPTARRSRLADSLEQALRVGRGKATVRGKTTARSFSTGLACADCGVSVLSPTPGLFSFNNPHGACPQCRGFGRVIEIDPRRVVPDESLTLRQGAIKPFTSPSRRHLLAKCLRFCGEKGIPVDVPYRELDAAQRELLQAGGRGFPGVRGFFRKLEAKKYKLHVRVLLARYRGYETCTACRGSRLRPEAGYFRIEGKTLGELWYLPVGELVHTIEGLASQELPRPVRLVADEIASRLHYLDAVGLGYLTLGRQARTLSGGEVERVNLTSALGSSLVGTLFVLDEPSIGLHARDNERLIGILEEIRARGNTVVVVEHDPAILAAAEHLVDLGPGSGAEGGRIVAQGTPREVERTASSLTGAYLSGRKSMPVPEVRRAPGRGRLLQIRGARANNLRSLDVDLPLDALVVLSGVSGSGKSTLLEEVLWKSWQRRAGEEVEGDLLVDRVSGLELVDEVVLVDQAPIGRTPRGNAATYTGVFDGIRGLFAGSPEAAAAGLTARHFSFNVEGGRCPECQGAGAVQVEMQFLSDVTLPCEACGGKRFRPEVLQVRLRGRSVDDVLGLTIREAAAFFAGEEALVRRLELLDALGLGYLTLGQPLNTLSGGESQRLKLAGRVLDGSREKLLFLLDEPTTGLHLEDVARLLGVLRSLVDRGHSVLVIEHHLDVLAAADWLVDLGPEGGEGGGKLVAQGTPEDIVRGAERTGSITGRWLGSHLGIPLAQATRRASRLRASGRGWGGSESIRVVGARENNLKNITVEIPRNQLVVVTGLSGSGKSSLLHDIVFAEGQRRYLDCMSPYARQFVEELHRPDMDHLEGIPPAVAIEQRTTVGGRKSTVGTVTEIYQFLRLLYSRAGTQQCPECSVDVLPRRAEEIVAEVRRLARAGGRLLVPAVRGKKGFHSKVLLDARRRGVLDARIDGKWVALPEDRELRLDRHRAHEIDLVLGRFQGSSSEVAELERSVAVGLEEGRGVVRWLSDAGAETVLSLERSCPGCGRDFEELDPRNFSFHSRHGACESCDGLGVRLELDPERLLVRWDLPLLARPDGPLEALGEAPFGERFLSSLRRTLQKVPGLPVEAPLSTWPKRALTTLLEGAPGGTFPGLLSLAGRVVEALPEEEREACHDRWGRERPCEACEGGRLRPEALAVRVGGRRLPELARMTVQELRPALAELVLEGRSRTIGEPILKEVLSRVDLLREVGLEYLSIDRSAATLSTGEAQRIRLAAQLGARLRGVCYILDEPTIGLHARDAARLTATLRRLRDQGNSVLVVEHDEETIRAADHIIDMGPGPGRHGGEVVAQGDLDDLLQSPRSATGAHFRRLQEGRTAAPPSSGAAPAAFLQVRGAHLNNLRGIDVRFPVGALTVVTGVSGAGKSTLVRGVLEESARRKLRGLKSVVGCRALVGLERISAVREVDQFPIGRTPRSTPATYVGLWNRIRAIFASTPEARARGYEAGRFSFNAGAGRCPTCAGQGRIKMEMSFLPEVSVDCEACRGSRFSDETLEVTYGGLNVGQVLGLSVEEALERFDAFPDLTRQLSALVRLGLGYLALGQASTTLSGGEAQRVKLAVELARTTPGAALYLLDEPTTGLHLEDVSRLVTVLRALAQQGHAVVVIEHHLDVVEGADWVVDLGPEAGAGGGELLYEGPPRGLLRVARSHTGVALAGQLGAAGSATARRKRPGGGRTG